MICLIELIYKHGFRLLRVPVLQKFEKVCIIYAFEFEKRRPPENVMKINPDSHSMMLHRVASS